MSEDTLLRIGRAVILGWGLRWPRKPLTAYSRGSIWVCPPDKADEWTAHKAMGDDWLNECLNMAGIPH